MINNGEMKNGCRSSDLIKKTDLERIVERDRAYEGSRVRDRKQAV